MTATLTRSWAASLAAERLKLRTVRTRWALAGAMTVLVLLAVSLHGLSLPLKELDARTEQLRVLAFGVSMGTVFAALLGALSITAEHRHGTIRPTLLGVPDRTRLLVTKAAVAGLASLGLGALASGVSLAALHASLASRGITVQLTGSDYARLVAGSVAAAAFWALIGLGLGSLVRNQVPAITGIFVWVFVIENILIDSAPDLSRYLPGSLAGGLAGNPVASSMTPVAAVALLSAYAAGTVLLATLRLNRTDVA
jgi:ABC-2 type transport system permease protein